MQIEFLTAKIIAPKGNNSNILYWLWPNDPHLFEMRLLCLKIYTNIMSLLERYVHTCIENCLIKMKWMSNYIFMCFLNVIIILTQVIHVSGWSYLRILLISWWRHQMETFSALLAICEGNSPVPGEFPTQRPVTWSSDVYFDLRLNKRLCKQP